MKKLLTIDIRTRADDPKQDGRLFREAEFAVDTRAKENGETETVVRASVSSEAPYLRTCMWNPEKEKYTAGYEVLGHADGEIDTTRMKDGLVIQDTHWGDQIGIIRKPEVKDGKIGGVIEFGCSERAQVIAKDAAAGIRRNMSVGYIVNESKVVGTAEDGLPIIRVVDWTPYEASFVNVPADTAVGVGRSHEGNKNGGEPAAKQKGIQIMETPVKAGYTAEQKVKIREMASAAHVSGEEVADILTSERSFEEIREELLNRREEYLAELAKKPAKPAAEARAVIDEGDTKKIRQKYDFVKVLRYYAEVAESKFSSIDIGFEREVSQELAKQTGRAVQGILLPDFVGNRAAANANDGGLTLGTPGYADDASTGGGISGIGGAGKNVIETLLLSGQFIDALVATLVLREQLGVDVLTGLVGNIAIPKGGSISGGWVAEGSNVAKKNPTFGQIEATPHTYGAYVDITRKLLLQSSVNVQAKVLEWLMYACAAGIETAAFQGTGSSGQPTGLCTALNSGATAWSNAPTFDKIVDLIAATKTANSYKPSMKFVGNAGVWAKLAKTRDYEVLTDGADTPKNVAAIGGSVRLLDTATNKVLGRDFVEANLMPAAKLLFGDFTQLAVCLWSGTDIIVDPYANDTNGGLRLVALQDSDILIKRPEAFKLATGVHS
ncbi:MAG: phage major capsid protein [Kiritimatiellae bacterium]|nr:phage major capsid protein [Kiritimatiellia bacterium]